MTDLPILDRAIAVFAPRLALDRVRARHATQAIMRYDAASLSRKTTVKPRAGDADTAGFQRQRLAFISRDLIRNNPWAARAQSVIVNNVVGDGIIPKVRRGDDAPDASGLPDADRMRLLRMIEDNLDTTRIDAHGRQNLYGLQRLAMNTIVDAGEVILRRNRTGERRNGIPLKIEVLEPDHLDSGKDGILPSGAEVREGIEYSPSGKRVAYWLFQEHPGSSRRTSFRMTSERVAAEDVLHVYRQDRPGQERGIPWLSPVALQLQDLHDYQDAQLVRQKIAATFAAFRIPPESEGFGTDADPGGLANIIPGRIQNLAPGEDIKFADPPGVDGYDEFTRGVLAAVAAGVGVTFEALSGDLRRVNFSSARMGRMEMDRAVSGWQFLMMIPQMLEPMGRWIMEAAEMAGFRVDGISLEWTPPRRQLVDPTREVPALMDMVRAGFQSRQNVIRTLGFDPERVMQEMSEDARVADDLGLVFDTDPRKTGAAGSAQSIAVEGGDNAE